MDSHLHHGLLSALDTEPITKFSRAHCFDKHDPAKPPLDRKNAMGLRRSRLPSCRCARREDVFGVPFYGKVMDRVKVQNQGLYPTGHGPAHAGRSYRELKLLPPESERKYVSSRAVTYRLT